MTIKIVDRPCGSGKTTKMLQSFKEGEKYLVVVPYLSEVSRVLEGACVAFKEPKTDEFDTKHEAIRELLIMGENIVTTHALYYSLVTMAREGLLDGYHLIIDEVPNVIGEGKGIKAKSYHDIYLEGGYLKEDAETGLVTPTQKWEEALDSIDDTLNKTVYNQAKSGCLYRYDDKFFIWLFPSELLLRNLTISVYTYLAKGSLLLAYLDKLGVTYEHDIDLEIDRQFRKTAKSLIEVKSLGTLDKANFSTSKQRAMTAKVKAQIARKLKKLREYELKGIDKKYIMVTSLKDNWMSKTNTPTGFSKGTGLFNETNWVGNTTRGTNEYNRCHTLVYLWEQYINDSHRRFLEMDDYHKSHDQYAISELIQWVYRSRVRNGEPITIYLPSPRMRGLLEDWLNDEVLKTDP